ncbi:hypothetical protein ACVQFQ_004493 [Yersinia enterocolitica]
MIWTAKLNYKVGTWLQIGYKMPECRRHIFLVPLKEINESFLNEIKILASYKSEWISFLLSIQESNSYNWALETFKSSQNIVVVQPDEMYGRTQHWTFIVKYANKNLTFDSFSYYFFGDELRLKKFPLLDGKNDIYINDYHIDEWDKIKENASISEIKGQTPNLIIRKSIIAGKPLLAPLQKIIFSKNMTNKIIFTDEYSYVSDQLMIHDLICNGAKVGFIKSPFYKINTSNRNYSNAISVSEVIKQQIYLYIRLKCLIGIPMILMRTMVKHFFKIR